ncbi:MAG: D-2-hydroxyacid dehydrogenase [Flavobacteriales bacterium]|nr:D-2-hydroxyacid dehydrogenase [Flavobacteriales bacterium]
MKILANDGLAAVGITMLEEAGHEVLLNKVPQEQLANFINDNDVSALLVRSATQARKDLIDACPRLKFIGRGGVGMDNIDVAYAREKGLRVQNTTAASSESVAELVFAHLFGGVRFLYSANREMPLEGELNFKGLKKAYGGGRELRGKTLGVLGFGRIGQATAKIALGVGMDVVYHDPFLEEATLKVEFSGGKSLDFDFKSVSKDELLSNSDFITLHMPAQKDGKYVLGAAEFGKMKAGAGVVNAARGGVVDEVTLLKALDDEHLSFAALDVFENEPTPPVQVLMHPKLSLSPHIGASTEEAQDRIGSEMAGYLIEFFG